jgi:alpha-glucoside transport system substrate-binding protein
MQRWHHSSRTVASTLGIALAVTAFGWAQAGTSSAATNCDAYAAYGTFAAGTSVTIMSQVTGADAALYEQSFADFETCTGIDIVWNGLASDFETTLQTSLTDGTAPDLAMISQPGLIASLATAGSVKPASAAVKAQAQANYSADWLSYGTSGGVFYAPPMGANVKSYVWYSPSMFATNGWAVPQTWAELKTLTATIAASGVTPWCAGFESGGATGWTGTDWLEDVLLRTSSATVYDSWVSHKIAFNDPQIVTALDEVGSILKNPAYVNGGLGDVASIATAAFQTAGLPILDGTCAMHRQASFYGSMWPADTDVAPAGDIFAFYLPGTATSRPVLGGGEFLATLNADAATQAVQLLFGSESWVNARSALGGWLSPNNKIDTANVITDIDKLSVQLLQDPKAVFRFDGSDMMPAAVGAGTFWTGMTNWVSGQSTADTLQAIESSWPAS